MLVLLLIGTLFWTSESLTVSEDQPSFDDVHNLFVYFQRKFSRNYHSEAERATRFSYFQDNVHEIRRLRETNPYAEFNLTALSDLSPEEMRRRRPRHASPPPGGLLKRHRVSEPPKQSALNLSVQEIPESIDWREKGALNPVRDQMQCGSCWAFAIVAVTESQWFLKHGTLPVLSEQMLISCDRKAHDCNGAFPDSAVDGVINEYGGKMSLRSSYPYASALSYNPPCDTSLISSAAVIAGYKDLETDEHLMAQWIAHHGPIVVAIDATDLSSYHGGIITNATSKEVDHAVVAVGYGISENIPYWIVRNSWNKSWGESGYFRVLRGFGLMLINASPLAIFVQEQSDFSL